jgi:hypothetical protein
MSEPEQLADAREGPEVEAVEQLTAATMAEVVAR